MKMTIEDVLKKAIYDRQGSHTKLDSSDIKYIATAIRRWLNEESYISIPYRLAQVDCGYCHEQHAIGACRIKRD